MYPLPSFSPKFSRPKEQFEIIRKMTKNNILRASLKLFAEKGCLGTSINDIAKVVKEKRIKNAFWPTNNISSLVLF